MNSQLMFMCGKWTLVFLAAFVHVRSTAACTQGDLGIQDQDPWETLSEEEAAVKELFGQFRSGEYSAHRFPVLAWDDIPALLKMAESKRKLTAFPRNPLSSQYVEESREGVIALWLIEGLRMGGKYPSLNALCLDKRATAERDLEAQSRANHDGALKQYTNWWTTNQMRPKEEAQQDNPLKGTFYSWY